MTRLQTVRLSKRMTRGDLAKAAGVSYEAIWRHEREMGSVNDDNLFKLADALGVEPPELVDTRRAAA